MPIILYLEGKKIEKFYLSYNWKSPYFRSLFDVESMYNKKFSEVSSMIKKAIENICNNNKNLSNLDLTGYDLYNGNHKTVNPWNWNGSKFIVSKSKSVWSNGRPCILIN